jgi:hypothetical protein
MDQSCGWIDGTGGADDEKYGSAGEFAVDFVHVEWDFTEPDDMRADERATGACGKWGGFVEGTVGEGLIALGAAGVEEGSMHVVETTGSGLLMEVVDVLGTEVETVP